MGTSEHIEDGRKTKNGCFHLILKGGGTLLHPEEMEKVKWKPDSKKAGAPVLRRSQILHRVSILGTPSDIADLRRKLCLPPLCS